MRRELFIVALVPLVGCIRGAATNNTGYEADWTYDSPVIAVDLRWDGVPPETTPTAEEFRETIQLAVDQWMAYYKNLNFPRPPNIGHGRLIVRVTVRKNCWPTGDWQDGPEPLDMGIKGWRCTYDTYTTKDEQLSWACHRVAQVLSRCPNCFELFSQVSGC